MGTVLAGTIGGTFGPLTLYAVGRYGGRPFILKFGKYFSLMKKSLLKQMNFERNGAMVALQQDFYLE